MKEIFYTFDMDWASDLILEDFIGLLKSLGIKATIFVTHDTEMLNEFDSDSVELGIHPNYNRLLSGDGECSYSDVLKDIKSIVPDAVSCRSHALTSSSIISKEYENYGIEYDLNTYIPVRKGNVIYPYEAPIGNHMVLPFIFEDDICIEKESTRNAEERLQNHSFSFKKGGVDFYLSNDFIAPRIFNFHPIHLYLNTDSNNTYVKAKPFYHHDDICNMRNSEGYGIRDMFVELVGKADSLGYVSRRIKDGRWKQNGVLMF